MWKLGDASKEKYLEAKEKARRAFYQAKCKSERKRFGNVMRRDNQKCDVLKIAKKIVKTNQNITGEQYIRNTDVYLMLCIHLCVYKCDGILAILLLFIR